MAYITSHNSYKIVTRNNFKNTKLEGQIYKAKIYIFSQYEENCLLAIQELMKDPAKYFTEIYDPIVAYDSKKYVYKEQQPAYHTDLNCERLSADFTNFELPQAIKERGETEIERFREWFKQNSYLLERPDVFVMRLQMAFGITYNPKAINYENSGFAEFKNYTIEDLEKKIDSLLKDAGRYYYANQKNTIILKAFGKNSGAAFTDRELNNHTGYSDEEVKEFLKDYHTRFKLPIKKLLIEYYRVKLNPDLEFADNLLEALGFKKCGSCKRGESSTSSNNAHWNSISNILDTPNDNDDLPF
jgi:hypothetical protein